MADRESRRAALVPEAARLLRSRDFRSEVARRVGKVHAAVVVLEDDPMSYLFSRVEDAGGAAVVIMKKDDSTLSLAIVRPASEARVQVACEDDRLSLIHDDSACGIFFAYLAQVESCVISRHSAQLIDDRQLEPVF